MVWENWGPRSAGHRGSPEGEARGQENSAQALEWGWEQGRLRAEGAKAQARCEEAGVCPAVLQSSGRQGGREGKRSPQLTARCSGHALAEGGRERPPALVGTSKHFREWPPFCQPCFPRMAAWRSL